MDRTALVLWLVVKLNSPLPFNHDFEATPRIAAPQRSRGNLLLGWDAVPFKNIRTPLSHVCSLLRQFLF